MAIKEMKTSRKNQIPINSGDYYKKLAERSKKRLRKNYGILKKDVKELRQDVIEKEGRISYR